MEYLRIFVDKIDRSATPGMAIAIDYEEAIGGKVIIVRVIDLPESIGSSLYHAAPIIGNQFACVLLHVALQKGFYYIMVSIGAARIASVGHGHDGSHRLSSFFLVQRVGQDHPNLRQIGDLFVFATDHYAPFLVVEMLAGNHFPSGSGGRHSGDNRKRLSDSHLP